MPGSVPEALQLPRIRATLQRMEDTIVFYLIERGQYALNAKIYEPGAFSELAENKHWDRTWLEWVLKELESSYAKLGRWFAPDEYPYTPVQELPAPVLTPMKHRQLLHPHRINVTPRIYEFYTREIVPRITANDGTTVDYNYGSSAVCDCEVLGALSRRIHYGMFVSESKFLANPAAFIPHIRSRNRAALEGLITKPEVERILLNRIKQKAEVYGQDLDSAATAAGGVQQRRKIDSDVVVALYEKYVIPLTKVVEVDYLLER